MKRPFGISLFYGYNRHNRIAKFFTPVLFLFLLNFSVFGQQGSKQNWATKPVATVESLTKDCRVFDTFTESGDNVYLRNKPDTKGQDYYFIVAKNKTGTLARKRIYPIINQ